nr:tRNA pseudouridine(38-40) synthase TruA [Planctomycetota bacterium]
MVENGGRRTLRIDLEFDGTDFEGWQRQARGRTVQGAVEAALERILGERHAVVGCGRTDAGVHAEHHVSSFRTTHAMPAEELARALDAVLPEDVGVLDLREMDPAFHAQKDAVWKWYRYRILVSRRKRPLRRRRVWRTSRVPALEALQAGSAPLVGRHDFRSFANLGSNPGSTVRTLHALHWSQEEEELRLDVVGDGFLYKMVRTLVGTLLQVAAEGGGAQRVGQILAARDRTAAGPAAPPTGLSLMAVAVRDDEPPARLPEM